MVVICPRCTSVCACATPAHKRIWKILWTEPASFCWIHASVVTEALVLQYSVVLQYVLEYSSTGTKVRPNFDLCFPTWTFFS
jgi:hypothetical protein